MKFLVKCVSICVLMDSSHFVWPSFQYLIRARIETGSAGRGVSTTTKHLMESTSISLDRAPIFWLRTATRLHHSTQCG